MIYNRGFTLTQWGNVVMAKKSMCVYYISITCAFMIEVIVSVSESQCDSMKVS